MITFLVVLAMAPSAQAAPPHSENVAGAWHRPEDPQRGDDVEISLFFGHNASVDRVRLVYCRAQNYACARPLNMTTPTHGTWKATIPWQDPADYRFAEFWRGVRDVGYNFTIHHKDGRVETSPTVHYPYDPGGLGPDSRYYFYALPEEPAASPMAGVVILLASLALLAGFVRRRAWGG